MNRARHDAGKQQAPHIVSAVEQGDPPIHATDEATNYDDSNTEKPWLVQRCLHNLNWMPSWCRWDKEQPPEFSIWLNILFAFAGAFTVANLYYNHPILNVLAHDFGVSYLTVSRVPTLVQAGYLIGLIFVCPLGDLFPRRQFTLILVLFTATLWIVLCLTTNFSVFLAFSFITSITTVTPQIMLPLVGELAPPHKRAFSLSIVVSGNLLGIVIARILSGVVTNYTNWRNIYWVALGLNYTIWGLLWLFMPDYPSSNPDGLNYFKMLWSILLLLKNNAVLLYAGLVSFCTSAAFMSYWTTLTFLLADPPYSYSPVVIGLFGLIGLAGMLLGPLYAKLFIEKMAPWYAVIFGELVNLIGVIIGTYVGTHSVAGPVIEAFTLDAGLQITQIANRQAIYAVAPKGRNRVNTAFMLMTFLGQLTGTSAGNKLYNEGGWVVSGSLSVGIVAFTFILCALRGPWEEGWFGWGGGFTMLKKTRARHLQIEEQERELERSQSNGVEENRIPLEERTFRQEKG